MRTKANRQCRAGSVCSGTLRPCVLWSFWRNLCDGLSVSCVERGVFIVFIPRHLWCTRLRRMVILFFFMFVFLHTEPCGPSSMVMDAWVRASYWLANQSGGRLFHRSWKVCGVCIVK